MVPPRRPRPTVIPLAALAVAGRAALAQPAVAPAPNRPSAGTWALPAATIPVTDPATPLVDHLLALVPVPGGIVGQRPYSVREVARLAAAAERELARRAARRPDGATTPAAEQRAAAVIAALRAGSDTGPAQRPSGARRTVRLRALDFAWAHAVGSGEAPRAVPSTNGPGFIDARTLPPLDLRYGARRAGRGGLARDRARARRGRVARGGGPAARVAGGGARRGRRGAFAGRRGPRSGCSRRAVVRNVAVQAGLDEWAVGAGRGGGRVPRPRRRHRSARSACRPTPAFALPASCAAPAAGAAPSRSPTSAGRRTSRTPSSPPTA
jgi:hypothetical protein